MSPNFDMCLSFFSCAICLHVQRNPARLDERSKALRRGLSEGKTRWNKDTHLWEDCEPWFVHYTQSLQRKVYGFELAQAYSGWTFGELAYDTFVNTGAVLLGVHDGEQIAICPQASFNTCA